MVLHGFRFQFINVEDFEGKGESQPTPYFYQNLGEAEYCVALFMYMCLGHAVRFRCCFDGFALVWCCSGVT